MRWHWTGVQCRCNLAFQSSAGLSRHLAKVHQAKVPAASELGGPPLMQETGCQDPVKTQQGQHEKRGAPCPPRPTAPKRLDAVPLQQFDFKRGELQEKAWQQARLHFTSQRQQGRPQTYFLASATHEPRVPQAEEALEKTPGRLRNESVSWQSAGHTSMRT